MIELRGERVTLRAFRRDEIAVPLDHADREHGADPRRRARLRRRYEKSGTWNGGFLDLAIVADGRVAGDVDVRNPPRGLPAGVYEVGITLFDPQDRGKGYGREAIDLVTRWLLRDYGAHRVQGSTALDNAAMRAVFERCGYGFEGTMRGFMAGEDYALYGITRADVNREGEA